MKRALTTGASLLFLGMLLHAATLERLAIDEMVQKSTSIAQIRVLDSWAAVHGAIIYTHYRLQVIERWKGPDAALDVVVPGGVAGGLRQTFSGAPRLVPNQEYVLFLWTSPSGLTHVIGLSQGIFQVKPGEKGELMAVRTASTELMLDSSGRAVRDQAVALRLADLRGQVSRGLAQGGRK